MIAFFDTSGLVPLLVEEPSSDLCRRLWDEADVVVCTQLAYVETAAALAQATRMGRMDAEQHSDSLAQFEGMWPELDVVQVGESLVREAAELTRSFPLRGYDAVHCAAALRLVDVGVTGASGDGALLDAWLARGLDVVDTRV